MLSRLSLRGCQGLTKCFVKFIPSATVSTPSQPPTSEPCVRASETKSVKRDLVNFPDTVKQEYPPPTRFLFIPEAFFQSFYAKTGVTGPYAFIFTTGTYLLSKEIVPVEHNFVCLMAWTALVSIINYKYADAIAEFWNARVKENDERIDKPQEMEKQKFRAAIKSLENVAKLHETVGEIMKAKRENVLFQLEAAYRSRLQQAYKVVKARLDCQVELEFVERRIAQKNLIDYVLKNVMKSITPEQEQNTMQNCIAQLNTLAAKA